MVPVSFASFGFQGQDFALGCAADMARAVYWAEQRALLVADLHLEKASFFARGGQMLPPYDSRDTLERLARAIDRSGARRVFCLGDNFHDAQGPARLEPAAAALLADLTRRVDWVWITGNHDEKGAPAPGTYLPEVTVDGIRLCHEAQPGAAGADISGHFHPRLTVVQRGRTIRRACVIDAGSRLVLPAFGTLTGGMDAGSPAIRAALHPASEAQAIVVAAGRIARFALWNRQLQASGAAIAL
jgi:DNA ligase-associated metallophosphoesterase